MLHPVDALRALLHQPFPAVSAHYAVVTLKYSICKKYCKNVLVFYFTCNHVSKMFFAMGQAPAGQAPTANRAYAIVRPNLLSAPETLGSWTDGHISCRHSAAIFFHSAVNFKPR